MTGADLLRPVIIVGVVTLVVVLVNRLAKSERRLSEKRVDARVELLNRHADANAANLERQAVALERIATALERQKGESGKQG